MTEDEAELVQSNDFGDVYHQLLSVIQRLEPMLVTFTESELDDLDKAVVELNSLMMGNGDV